MAKFAPLQAVDPPPRLALPYGIFSVASFAETAMERWENGVVWNGINCEPAAVIVADCDPETQQLPWHGDDAQGNPQEWPSTMAETSIEDAFTVIGSYKCGSVGNPIARAQEQAREHLELREEYAVEKHLWSVMANDENMEVLPGGDAALALGMLEKWLGENYGALGVIHMSRLAAMSSHEHLDFSGGQAKTILGTPVVIGSGYPGEGLGTTPFPNAAEGTEYVAASPALKGYRSEIFYSSSREGDLLDRRNNDLYGLAQRQYLVGYDNCGVAFAPFTLGG